MVNTPELTATEAARSITARVTASGDKEPTVSESIEIITDATISGNQLKLLLDKRGMTQEEAAERLGVSYRHFNRIVLNRSEPSLLMAARIEKLLGVSYKKVFDIEVKTKSRRLKPAA